jgi:hypothetical protein
MDLSEDEKTQYLRLFFHRRTLFHREARRAMEKGLRADSHLLVGRWNGQGNAEVKLMTVEAALHAVNGTKLGEETLYIHPDGTDEIQTDIGRAVELFLKGREDCDYLTLVRIGSSVLIRSIYVEPVMS